MYGILERENAMAYIRKKRGKWVVEIQKRGYPRVSKSFVDIKTARKFGREIESQMERNVFEDYSGARGTSLREVLVRYRDEKTVNKKSVKEETNTINYLINHKIALNSLMTLKSHHIHKLMRELSVSRKPSTVNKYVQLICHAWRVAKREWGINLPAQNPCDFVTKYKVRDARDRVLDIDENQRLLQSCEEQDNAPNSTGENSPNKQRLRFLKDIVMFAYQTGARQGEILKLKRSHINFEKRMCTFYDTKNEEDRTIPLADATLEILKKYRFGPYVFNTNDSRLRKWFRRATKDAMIDNFRFHDLRACFCTNALLSGMSIAEVSALSGHKDWSQLKRYTRIKPEDLLVKINNVIRLNKAVS